MFDIDAGSRVDGFRAEQSGELRSLLPSARPRLLRDGCHGAGSATAVAELSAHADLYRCRSLPEAGVPLALSSDAPCGPLDPLAVIAAAVDRRTPAGDVVGQTERLTPAVALDAYLSPADDPGGRPRRVALGEPADLVLLDVPLRHALATIHAGSVRATFIGGRIVHGG